MIHHISGKLALVKDGYAVVEVGGLGFKLSMSGISIAKLPKPGAIVNLVTHLHVREDVLALYGFTDQDELELFESLTSVSGIGPKSALAVMSLAPVERLRAGIVSGETELLQKSSGIGKKTAERIILELKDKISPAGHKETITMMKSDRDVYEALTSLGYSAAQAKDTLSQIDGNLTGTKERLKEALKILKSN